MIQSALNCSSHSMKHNHAHAAKPEKWDRVSLSNNEPTKMTMTAITLNIQYNPLGGGGKKSKKEKKI